MKKQIISKMFAIMLAATLAITGMAPATAYANEIMSEETECTEIVETEEVEGTETAEETEAVEETETEEVEGTETAEETVEEFDEVVTASNNFSDKQCGENVYASLSGGTLTLSGTGATYNYSFSGDGALGDFRNAIREIVVGDEITSIGKFFFAGLDKVEKVTLGSGLETIGEYAFYGTTVGKLKCPSSLRTISSLAFYDASITSVSLNDGLEIIDTGAFSANDSLKEAVIPEGCVVLGSAFSESTTLHYKTTVTLNANGGNISGASTKKIIQYEKETYGKPTKLPTPVRDGYDFLGWYDYTDGEVGDAVAGTSVRYHAILIAKWCNHSKTTVKNKKSSTYTSEGYTGDTYCSNCGKLLTIGKTTEKKVLAAPKLSAIDNTAKGLKIRWTASKDADGYYVYRRVDGKYKKIAKVTGNNTKSYVDEDVKSKTGKTYSYKVCAYHGKATSKLTSAKSQVRAASTKFSTAKSKSKKTMNLEWKKVKGATGYQVQYTKDKNFKKNVTTKKIKKNSTTTTKISKLSSGKKYYVRVRSYVIVNEKKYYSGWTTTTVKVK